MIYKKNIDSNVGIFGSRLVELFGEDYYRGREELALPFTIQVVRLGGKNHNPKPSHYSFPND